jgi:hypothetical protein
VPIHAAHADRSVATPSNIATTVSSFFGVMKEFLFIAPSGVVILLVFLSFDDLVLLFDISYPPLLQSELSALLYHIFYESER